jgi:hypothetical protein
MKRLLKHMGMGISIGLAANFAVNADQPAELIQAWNNEYLNAIRLDSSAPAIASKKMAILHIAMFEAANSLDPHYESYLELVHGPEGLNPTVAAIGAAYRVGEIVYPGYGGKFRILRDRQLRSLGAFHKNSLKYGYSIADQIIQQRSNDGSSRSITYIPRNEIGVWKRTPPRFRPPETAQWVNVQPFCIVGPAEKWISGPPQLSSEAYAFAWKQVKDLGDKNSVTRTHDQTEIAQFWACFTYTATPAGHWNEIACNLLVEKGTALLESLRLLTLMNLALADAGIVAWRVKYDQHFWRPIYAIRMADEDENSATYSDPNWESLLEAPPHPEYVSGHSTYTGAGAEVLRLFLGKDAIPFSATSDSLPGVTRHFGSISACEQEIGMSRIYGGIHFIFSNLDGLELGHQIGEKVYQNYLRPLKE